MNSNDKTSDGPLTNRDPTDKSEGVIAGEKLKVQEPVEGANRTPVDPVVVEPVHEAVTAYEPIVPVRPVHSCENDNVGIAKKAKKIVLKRCFFIFD